MMLSGVVSGLLGFEFDSLSLIGVEDLWWKGGRVVRCVGGLDSEVPFSQVLPQLTTQRLQRWDEYILEDRHHWRLLAQLLTLDASHRLLQADLGPERREPEQGVQSVVIHAF